MTDTVIVYCGYCGCQFYSSDAILEKELYPSANSDFIVSYNINIGVL